MEDVLVVGKITCHVAKLLVHALHSNFAKDSLEIWNVMLIFRIKIGGELKNKRNIFIEGKILTSSKSRGVHMKKSKHMKCDFSQ